jgi:hypothetical protein
MKPAAKYHCEVCGAPKKGEDWFLVTEDPGQDTLQILKWNIRLAEQEGMRHLCTSAHVEELVSHWMMTGSLDYGWSQPVYDQSSRSVDRLDGSFRLGELMLDRASFAALGERPDMLSSILEAIDGALQAAASKYSDDEEKEDAVLAYDA